MDSMDSMLKDFPVVTEIQVAWGEMDALQHVNNVVYFRYFETARLDYFNKIGLLVDMSKTHIGPRLRDTQCRYKLPITYPDTLLLAAELSTSKMIVLRWNTKRSVRSGEKSRQSVPRQE